MEAAWPALRVDTVPPGLSQTEQKEITTQRIKVESLANGVSSLRRQYQGPLMVVWGISALVLTGRVCQLRRPDARTDGRARSATGHLLRVGRLSPPHRPAAAGRELPAVVDRRGGCPAAGLVDGAGRGRWCCGKAPLRSVQSLTPDGRVLALTGAIAIATGLVIGVLPAWTASRSRPQAGLRPDRTVAHVSGRWGKALLVAQVAVSLVFCSPQGCLRRA